MSMNRVSNAGLPRRRLNSVFIASERVPLALIIPPTMTVGIATANVAGAVYSAAPTALPAKTLTIAFTAV